MKARLTENGVLALYNSNCPSPAKVQVLYLAHWNMVSFLRVTDSKHLSPIMVIMKMNDKFIVGDIILIKKAQFQPSTQFKDEEIIPIIDSDLNHIVILEYQVVEKKGKLGILFAVPNANGDENPYWNSLSLVKNSLIKGDNMAESFFKEGEKRLQLLRPDCNLLRERGNELFKRQNFCKAILHYDMAKQKDHYDARVWNNSSQAYFFNNEYTKARRDALVALKLDPFSKKAYFRAGRAMEKAGDINGALEVIEAGLYVCGKCEDLDKLLRQIKGKKDRENSISSSNSSSGTSSSTNLPPQSKKKITTTTTTESNEVASETPISIVSQKKNLKPKESPLKKVRDSEPKSETKIDALNEAFKLNKTPISSLLIGAKMLYEKGKYKNAFELYDVANTTWAGNSNCKEIEVVRYLIDVCKIKLKVEDIEEVKKSLMAAIAKDNFPFPPALHYWLAKVYEIFENEDKVTHHANACLHLLESSNSNSLFWPGTKEIITETSPDELKKWFTEGSWRSAPLARCRHVDCISTQNHSLAKTEIYPSDIDFRGYVEVECEELCSICYHPCCWKAIKEQSEDGQLGKKTDKDFLGLQCFTPDCTGKVSGIRIYDETSQLRNEIVKDKKDKKNITTTKLKKKKEKKKVPFQGGKFEDKKKFKGNDAEDAKLENEVENVKEETTVLKKPQVEKTCPPMLEQVDFEGTNYKVLRPGGDDTDEYLPQASKKSKPKKKKKGKQVAQINIGDDIEDRFVHNEYLTRLRALRAQREALESDAVHLSSTDIGGLKYLPECILDPERPFYLPQHLQENPAQLESILRIKMATTSSSDIDKESIATLLEFMYDWLKAHSPMLVTDSRIKDYISENFPSNAVAYVNKCGGIRSFLLQSFRFALIDEVVCVNEQVVAAQDASIHIVLEKFKMTKFLISDGHKAMKLSHLLDDTKSTCSSNSSLSANFLAAAVAASGAQSDAGSSASRPASMNTAAAATPYKNAALGMTGSKDSESRSEIVAAPAAAIPPTLAPAAVQMTSKSSNVKKPENENVSRKPKLKTMDIDAFEDVIESAEMGQLFTPSPNSSDKTSKGATPSGKDIFFHSDDEMDTNMPTVEVFKKATDPHVLALKETIDVLESELSYKNEQLTQLAEEKERLTSQNQQLNDRFSQIKTKSSVEIATWKKSTEDAQEQTKIAKSNLDSYKTQKEGEVRKLLGEKARFQEDMKAFTLKTDSLQLTIDQLNSAKAQLEEENSQTSIQLAKQEMQLRKYQESTEVMTERARDAESKYISMKRDLIKMNLEKTKKRLTAEVNKMREMLLEATDETHPNKPIIIGTIYEWEDTIVKLSNNLQTVTEDCQKLLECIRLGRSLSSLPPGDLQIPSVPDLTVAHLLFIGKPSPAARPDKLNPVTSGIGYMGLNSAFPQVSSSLHSQFAGLGPGGTFSLGQLGTPTHTPTMVSQLEDEVHKDPNLMGASGLPDHRMPPPLAVQMGLGGIANSQSSRSPGFAINGVTTSLSVLSREEFNKGASSNSSPIPVPMPPMASPSPLAGTSDFTPNFMASKPPPSTDPNQIFVGQLPWSFTEDHLKAVFSKYDVVAAVIHDKGHTNEGKPVPKCGFVTFRSQHERDRVLQSGPITYGNHTLNIQAKEIKRPSNKVIPPPPPVLGPVPDLPLIPPPSSSISSLNHHPSSQPPTSINKQGGVGSAFGLQSLLEASSRGEPRTVATPTTPTATKPKFQNLRSNNNIGAIGTLPPKVVRPTPRPGATAIGVTSSVLQPINKDDTKTNSVAYRRLIEECKQKFGNEYPHHLVQKAIIEVREQNNNSLSGIANQLILDQVEIQLQKRLSSKPSIAPWAQLTQTESLDSPWQGPPLNRLDNISEDHCSICLETLNTDSTMPLPCQHVFHIKCIKHWLDRKRDCPICRKFALNSDEYPSLSHG